MHNKGTVVAAAPLAILLVLPILIIALIAGAGATTNEDDCATGTGGTAPDMGAETVGDTALDPDQMSNAATIVAAVRSFKPTSNNSYAAVVALATALQESSLHDSPEGDRDSAGLFQQRPSQGWGNLKELTDPTYATHAFLKVLVKVEGWHDMPLTQAAATVQRPRGDLRGEYAKWESLATELVSRLWATQATGPETVPVGLGAGGTCPTGHGEACPPSGSAAERGLQPNALAILRTIHAEFGTHLYGGVGERTTNPTSDHPNGLAVDVMIEGWNGANGKAEGKKIADWAVEHAEQFGVDYIIWAGQSWSAARPAWKKYTHRSGATDASSLHVDHVHVSVEPGDAGACAAGTGGVVFPIPEDSGYIDQQNWGKPGGSWANGHTGTDLSVACGTPVFAATSGTIIINTNAAWSGRWLVQVSTAQGKLTTWYGHMQALHVKNGQTVQAGQHIGDVGGDDRGANAEGNTTGCHLHIEVHPEGGSIYEDNIDPSTWLEQNVGRNRSA